MSMENFFNYVSKPVSQEDVAIWFKMNNILPEKMELYYDFVISLYELILDTYLGDDMDSETKVTITDEDNIKHFNWCWIKTVENFQKEEIVVGDTGEHHQYFEALFLEIFYNQTDVAIRKAIKSFFTDLFSLNNEFSQSDLDMVTTIYKNMDKNTTYNLY